MSIESANLPEHIKKTAQWLDECHAKHYERVDIESMDPMDASGMLDTILQGTVIRRLLARLKEGRWMYRFHATIDKDDVIGIGYTATSFTDVDTGVAWLRESLQTPDETRASLERHKEAVREARAALLKAEGAG